MTTFLLWYIALSFGCFALLAVPPYVRDAWRWFKARRQRREAMKRALLLD